MKRHLLALLGGAVVGAVLGWYTPELQRVQVAHPEELRRVLAIKSALVLGSMGYMVSMYLAMRKRAIERWTRKP